jgi:hypothetical protein
MMEVIFSAMHLLLTIYDDVRVNGRPRVEDSLRYCKLLKKNERKF